MVRRRNSSLMRSSALLVRSTFHCSGGNCKNVNNSSPASSSELTTALHRSRHFRRSRRALVRPLRQSQHTSCTGNPRPTPRAEAPEPWPAGCAACDWCSSGPQSRAIDVIYRGLVANRSTPGRHRARTWRHVRESSDRLGIIVVADPEVVAQRPIVVR